MVPEQPLLRLDHVTQRFPGSRGSGHRDTIALDGVTLQVEPGASVGIVGDSGAGKSTLAWVAAGLLRPTSGAVLADGVDLRATGAALRAARRHIGLVFQDAPGSFNPQRTVEHALATPLENFTDVDRGARRRAVGEMMERVGLRAAQMTRYPHEFSGGQMQRLAIARALITHPRVVILDEPVSALDVSIRAQILNLLRDLAAEFNLTYLLIASDATVLEHMCAQVCVMYAGRIVEQGSHAALFSSPRHPYTASLLAVAGAAVTGRDGGPVLSATRAPKSDRLTWEGCPFSGICPLETDRCATVRPEPVGTGPDHLTTCLAYDGNTTPVATRRDS